MTPIDPTRPWALHDVAATRRIERAAALRLPRRTLMKRAGLATARLAMALAPHARQFWVVCGVGNNGGDGLETAIELQRRRRSVIVTLTGDPSALADEAADAYQSALDAGVTFSEQAPAEVDFLVDAILGIGARPGGRALASLPTWLDAMNASGAPRLCVDVPSGLLADTGQFAIKPIAQGQGNSRVSARFCTSDAPIVTLSLLTLKPGLFTGVGRDHAGQVWLDDLGCTEDCLRESPVAWTIPTPAGGVRRAHASHKGSHGDVAIVGGSAGMEGAAWLAARAALHGGAGRVYLALLSAPMTLAAANEPSVMQRDPGSLDLSDLTVVCGCGGGSAVRAHLPRLISTSARLVMDADALNAVASDPALQQLLCARGRHGRVTVLTPHPLEAARLLASSVVEVQADRVTAAQTLARHYGAVVALKGSGTVVASPDGRVGINLSGNARLATGGTGDVLAGWIGATLAGRDARDPYTGCAAVVAAHGALADHWPQNQTLSATALSGSLRPV